MRCYFVIFWYNNCLKTAKNLVMKNFTFILLLISSVSFAQQNELQFSGYYGTNMYNKPSYLGGIQYELGINERISLNYGAKLGFDTDKGITFQSPMGAFGGTTLFFWGIGDDEDFYTIGVLAWMLPDGVTFNFKVDESTKICPYINPFSLEYSSKGIYPYLECGIKVKEYLSNSMFLGLNLGLSTTYGINSFTNYIGGTIGFVVDNNESSTPIE